MGCTVYIVRHAESEGNLYRRVHGQYDSRVTARGRAQIEALRLRFKDVPIDAVYASDLTRTRMTARALTDGRDLEAVLMPALREVDMGLWEDRGWGDVAYEYPGEFDTFNDRPHLFHAPGGESMIEVADRMEAAFHEITQKNAGKTVCIVTHGMAIRALLNRLYGHAPDQITKIPHCDNTAVCKLEAAPGVVEVLFRGDNTHLGESLSTFASQRWWRAAVGESAAQSARRDLHFRFVPLGGDVDLAERFRREAWLLIHGNLEHYSADYVREKTARMARACPRAVVLALDNDKPAGIVELDIDEAAYNGDGHIAFVYLTPEYRGRGLGVQLIGHAISAYRELGRSRLRLRVADTNLRARNFYRGLEFYPTGEEIGSSGRLIVLHKDIRTGKAAML